MCCIVVSQGEALCHCCDALLQAVVEYAPPDSRMAQQPGREAAWQVLSGCSYSGTFYWLQTSKPDLLPPDAMEHPAVAAAAADSAATAALVTSSCPTLPAPPSGRPLEADAAIAEPSGGRQAAASEAKQHAQAGPSALPAAVSYILPMAGVGQQLAGSLAEASGREGMLVAEDEDETSEDEDGGFLASGHGSACALAGRLPG